MLRVWDSLFCVCSGLAVRNQRSIFTTTRVQLLLDVIAVGGRPPEGENGSKSVFTGLCGRWISKDGMLFACDSSWPMFGRCGTTFDKEGECKVRYFDSP